MQAEAESMADLMKRKAAKQGNLDTINLSTYDELSRRTGPCSLTGYW